MSVQQITVNVDGYLALNKYEVDEANAHIELVEDPSDEEFDKLVMGVRRPCTSESPTERQASIMRVASSAAHVASPVGTP